jgi:hypothetical protein
MAVQFSARILDAEHMSEHAHALERASAEPIRTGHPRAAGSVEFETTGQP